MKTKEWLKKQRKLSGITQKELAEKIGTSPFTIEQIEQGRRLGSADTWDKIENYFENGVSVSYESEELIEEIKQDIEEFGENYPCILIYKIIDDSIFFTNYDFIIEEDEFNEKTELEENEKYLTTTLKYALEVFQNQNKIISKEMNQSDN